MRSPVVSGAPDATGADADSCASMHDRRAALHAALKDAERARASFDDDAETALAAIHRAVASYGLVLVADAKLRAANNALTTGESPLP